jgi:hypothetical protein
MHQASLLLRNRLSDRRPISLCNCLGSAATKRPGHDQGAFAWDGFVVGASAPLWRDVPPNQWRDAKSRITNPFVVGDSSPFWRNAPPYPWRDAELRTTNDIARYERRGAMNRALRRGLGIDKPYLGMV